MLPPFLLLRSLNRSGNRISKQNLVSFMISQSLNSLGNKNSGQTKECFYDSEPLAQYSCVHSRQHSCQQLKKNHKTLKNMRYRSLFLKYGSLFVNR